MINVAALLKEVCQEFRITHDRLISKQRSVRVVAARDIIIKCLRDDGWSYPEIGRLLNRDHSTIVHALKRINKNIVKSKNSIDQLSLF